MIEPLGASALLEDLGRAGDVTTDAIVPRGLKWNGVLVARQAGVVAGLDLRGWRFSLIDPAALKLRGQEKPTGQRVAPKDVVAVIGGPPGAL